MIARKILRLPFFALVNLVWFFAPPFSTRMIAAFLAVCGATVRRWPNYISARVWFDGGDYSLITIGQGVTISSNVRILTHDWAPYTAARALGLHLERPIGNRAAVILDDYCFVGTGSIILPGSVIGRGAVVGAGSVVRGSVPCYTVVAGNPAREVGSTSQLVQRYVEIS